MSTRIRPFLACLVALLPGSSLPGCYLPPPVYMVEARPRPMRVPMAPPPARLEVRPAAPDESYVWQEGYWSWSGDEYQWIEGSWMPPQPGFVFIAAAFTFVNGCWSFTPPYWCPASECGGGLPPRHGEATQLASAPAPQARGPVILPPITVKATPAKTPVTVKARPLPTDDAAVLPGGRSQARVDEEPRVVGEEPDRPGRRPVVIPEEPDSQPELDEPRGRVEVVDLRTRPEYRGTRGGRPVFSDPDRPVGFRTDVTGAVVLHGEPRRVGPGGLPPPLSYRGPRTAGGRIIVVNREPPSGWRGQGDGAGRHDDGASFQRVVPEPPPRPMVHTEPGPPAWSGRPISVPYQRPSPPEVRTSFTPPVEHRPSFSPPAAHFGRPSFSPPPAVHAAPSYSAPIVHRQASSPSMARFAPTPTPVHVAPPPQVVHVRAAPASIGAGISAHRRR